MDTELVPVAAHLGLEEGCYKVNMKGQLWSSARRKFLEPKPTSTGYLRSQLTMADGSIKSKLHHVVIQETFRGPTPTGMVIDHTNRNRLDNMRYVTPSDNTKNRDWSNAAVGNRRPVLQYSQEAEFSNRSCYHARVTCKCYQCML
jgi:hypothetical protein